jgi:hypothetical protein
MLRRNLFVVAVLLALILSAAFASWTQDTSDTTGKSVRPPVSSSPPDSTKYSRPATPGDRNPTKSSSALSSQAVLSSPGFTVVEVPGSGGGEPDIAINPLNQKQIVIHQGFGGWSGNATNFISNDGGITWTASNQIPPPTGVTITSGPNDITHDYGLDGNLYGAYLTGVPPGGACGAPNFDVFSASNTNPIFGGLFSYFTIAGVAQLTDFNGSQGCADQPWLLTNVDPVTAGQTNTYVGYDDDSGNNMRVSVALGTQPPNFVTDNVAGVTFGGGINQGFRLAVDSRTGAVYSLYQVCTGGCAGSPKSIGYILNRSLDAGTTWTLNGSGTGIQVASGTTVQPQPKFGTVNALLGGIDHAAVDPTTGNVFVVYGGSNGSGGNAVFIKRITFDNSSPTMAIPGSPHQVSLSGAQAALPSVAVAPNGTVGVLYTSFDGFDVNGFPIFSGHFAFSTDAGATFTDQTLLTFLSTTKDNGNPRQRFLGDYQQLKVVNDPPPANAGATFYGVFTGNGAALGDPIASNQAIFFKVTLAPQINLNPNPLAIGPVCKGSTGSGQLEVADTGADNLLINSITKTSGSTDISLASGPTFPVNISPDANFNFTFNCTPTTVGTKSATFNIASNDPASPNTAVTVTCSAGSGSVLLTGSGEFGLNVCAGSTPSQTIKVNNVGTCTLNLLNAFVTCPDFSLVNPPAFPVPISPDSAIDLTVKFTPTSGGPKACTLEVVTDDPINPMDFFPLTGTTPTGTASLTFPSALTFPPTVIQQSAACSSSLGVPVVNSGACPVMINSVTLNNLSATPDDYSLTGVPGLPIHLGPSEQLGAGNLDVVFAPFTLARQSTGTVDVDYENDPVTHTFTTVSVPFCGEATRRGLRVLVTQGGVPVSNVRRIFLQTADGPEQTGPKFQLPRTIKNAPLQTVTGTAPCPSFSFHAEYGGESNPFQLKDGTYRIKVQIKVGKKTKIKIVRVNIDQCTFTKDVVVAFP